MFFSYICREFQCLCYYAGFIESAPSVEKVKVFEKYFTCKIHLYNKVLPSVCLGDFSPIKWWSSQSLLICWQDEIERQGSVLVNYADLTGEQSVCEALPDLTTEINEQPQLMLNCLGLAIHQVWRDGKKCCLIVISFLMGCFYVHVSGVDSWFGESGCWVTRRRTSCCRTNHQHPSHQCTVMPNTTGSLSFAKVAAHEWTWLNFYWSSAGCLTMNLWLLCGCCVPVHLGGWCVWREQWSEWAALDLSARGWRSDAWGVHTHSLFCFSRGSMQPLPRYAKLNSDSVFGHIFKYLYAPNLMHMHVFIVWSAWMSESFFHALSEFSHHTDRRLADH